MRPSLTFALLFAAALADGQQPLLGALEFSEVSAEWGVRFEHRHFGVGEKMMPENMGAGVAVFDYDQDGLWDLYLVQGAPVRAGANTRKPGQGNRLYRQVAPRQFEDVTERAGVGDTGVGMGVVVGDFDGDQMPDLYVTNFGPNVLYRNRGDGSFEEITGLAEVAGSDWSTGAAFVDADQDGDLDLYVANYLEFAPAENRFCGNAQNGIRAYCHPDFYGGARDRFYENIGGGLFEEVTDEVGLAEGDEARGLGVLVADLDEDHRQDIYVANDTTANHAYVTGDDLRLEETALWLGLAVNGRGKPEASMGVARGDLDGDGRAEILVTHLDEETNTLYGLASTGYRDLSSTSGLGPPSRPWVGFGLAIADLDLDGRLDVVVANGHIIDNIDRFDSERSHAQPLQVFLNDGATFELLEPLGDFVGRGLVASDLDGDGDHDLILTQNNGPARIFENRVTRDGGTTSFTVRGVEANWRGGLVRSAVGVRWLGRAPSYLSQAAPQVVLPSTRPSSGTVEVDFMSGVRRYQELRAAHYVLP